MTGPAPASRRTSLGLVFVAALAVLAWYLRDLLLVAFIAVLLAVYLGGLTDLLVRLTRLRRGAALLLSLLITLLALAGIGLLVAPAVVAQTEDLITAIPGYLAALDQMVQRLASTSEAFRRTGLGSAQSGVATVALNESLDFLRHSFFSYAADTGRVLIDSLAVLAMGLYAALRPSDYLDGVLWIVPPERRATARAIVGDIGDTLRAWVGAQLLAMVVLATATAIGLLILGVPYWLAFGLLAGLAVMIPFFGSMTSTLLPALLVLPDRGPLGALAVASVGVGVHLLEANIVHPIIMQHRVALPPAMTILAVLVMGALAGVLGMVVAVPLLATLIVLVRHILIYQTYGERPAGTEPVHAVLQPVRPSQAAMAAIEGL